MNLKVLSYAMLTVPALALSQPASSLEGQLVQAQLLPQATAEEVEQALAAFTMQLNNAPPKMPNATFEKAEANGRNLLMRFRYTTPSSILSPEQFAAQTLKTQCQLPAVRGYTDQYGISMTIQIDAADGGKGFAVKLDRETCTKVAGPSTAAPSVVNAGRPATANISQAMPGANVGGCGGYLGQVVTPLSFDSVATRFGSISPKSEYETTAQYEARRASAVGSSTGPFIIEKTPEGSDQFPYDADIQQLRIMPFAFDNTFLPAWEIFYSARLDRALGVSTSGNIDVVVSQRNQITGSYKATNGFGATVTVASTTRTTKAIFDRGPLGGNSDDNLFPGSITRDYKVNPIGTLRLTPSEASVLKPSLRIALVVVPRAPYLVKGSTRLGNVTVRNPNDVTVDFTVLTADIQCGLVMDGSGRVLGAYATS